MFVWRATLPPRALALVRVEASMPNLEPQLHEPVMAGIVLPERLNCHGKSPKELEEQWMDVIETLWGRGVHVPNRMGKLLGISPSTAKRLMGMVKTRWKRGLSTERINWRREALYAEAEEIARMAWQEALEAATSKERLDALKVVLTYNQRRASLCGLDKLEVKLEAKVEKRLTANLVAVVEERHNLPSGALAVIGKQLAMTISKTKAVPGRVIEAPTPATATQALPQGEEAADA